MTDEPKTERERFIAEVRDAYIDADSPGFPIVFALEMLGPILLDIRDCLASIADRMPPR